VAIVCYDEKPGHATTAGHSSILRALALMKGFSTLAAGQQVALSRIGQ
jgi:hypothetical protein